MKKLVLLAALLSFTWIAQAQTLTCHGATNLNLTGAYVGTAQPEDTAVDYGCITATGRHVWYGFFTVCSSGILSLNVVTSSSANDVDVVVWGPFNDTTILCNQLTAGNIAGCSATPNSNEVLNMGTVSQGQVYMMTVVADSATPIPVYAVAGTAVITGSCPPQTNCYPVSGEETLCLVTVDSVTQEYHLIWNEYAANPVTHFGIIRYDYLNMPQEIDTVHVTSLSEYIDLSADPAVHTERYSLVTYDTCGTSWSAPGYIQPVFCQSSLSTQGTVNVSWSPYIDTYSNGPAYYVIYRGATPTTMVSIDTVASFVNNYTDINPLIGTSYYKIGVALYSACTPMRLQQNATSQYYVQSFSNASSITVVGIGENSLQQVALFPNPSDGNIMVKNITDVSTMRVYDIAGRMVFGQQLQQNASQFISVAHLETGIYTLTIENETGFYREEIIVQH